MGMLEVSSEKFKAWHNETFLLLQYCKLKREQNENAKELMDCLRIKAKKCGYKVKDWRLKEKSING